MFFPCIPSWVPQPLGSNPPSIWKCSGESSPLFGSPWQVSHLACGARSLPCDSPGRSWGKDSLSLPELCDQTPKSSDRELFLTISMHFLSSLLLSGVRALELSYRALEENERREHKRKLVFFRQVNGKWDTQLPFKMYFIRVGKIISIPNSPYVLRLTCYREPAASHGLHEVWVPAHHPSTMDTYASYFLTALHFFIVMTVKKE